MNKTLFVLSCSAAILALSGPVHAAETKEKSVSLSIDKKENVKTYSKVRVRGKRFRGSNESPNETCSGAAVRVQGDLAITDSSFTDNGNSSWGTWGGAVYNGDKGEMNTGISNTVFTGNKAHHGGALALIGKKQNVVLTDVNFNDNHALSMYAGMGGAIFLQGEKIRFLYEVSAGKTIVNSGNTAVYGGFLHTHNGGINLVFDVGRDAMLVIGQKLANADSLNLARGTTFRKTGSGTMIINSSITQESPYGGQTKVDGSDFVVEKGVLQLTHAGQIKGVMEVLSGGSLIIPDGCTVEKIIVHKGARLVVEKGGKVSTLEKNEGARVELLGAADKVVNKTSDAKDKKDGVSK